MKSALVTASMFLITTSTAMVFADEPTTDPAAPPAETPPQTATDDKGAAGASNQAPEEKPVGDQGGRVRWGVSPAIGWHFPQSMFTIGSEGHVGYQISNPLSVFGTLGGTAGFGFSANAGFQGATVTASAVSYWYLGAIAEYMLKDLFYFGGGPVLARGAIAGASVGVNSSGVAEVTETASVGFKPGIDFRIGLGFGKAKNGSYRRGGFNLGIDGMLLFHPNTTFIKVAADGPNGTAGTRVTTNGTGITFVPMLTLGYDSR